MKETIFTAPTAQRAITRRPLASSSLFSPFLHFLVLALGCLPMIVVGGEQTGYTIRGRLQREEFYSNGTNKLWTRDFNLTVEGCSWAIESVDISGKNHVLSARMNGLMHTVTKVNPDKVPGLNDFYESIEDDEVPPSFVSEHAILWLAFASDCYLKSV